MAGKARDAHLVMGAYDLVVVTEVPNDGTAAKVALDLRDLASRPPFRPRTQWLGTRRQRLDSRGASNRNNIARTVAGSLISA
jgi:hypothetical protein